MKYEQPYGVADPNASYINGNPATGIQGSIPPAAAFEFPMRELVALITNAGFVPTDGDLAQLTRAVRQGVNFLQAVAVGGNPNVLQATSILPLDQYRQGLPLRVLIPLTNTGPASISVDNLGAITIIRGNGAQLSAGDLPGGMVAVLVFDGTNFQIENFQGFTSSTTNNNTFMINLPYIPDSGTVNNIVANFSPALTGVLVAGGNGGEILVKLKNSITGPTTIMVNSIGPIPVYRPTGAALQSGDIVANQILWLIFDGIGYQVANLVPVPYNDLIDTSVTYTVGSGGTFSDFNAALEYLSKYKITQNGLVTLQALAGQAVYSSTVTIDHPNLGRIRFLGAAMLGAPDPTLNSYARNGWWNRASDGPINLAYLRSKFATELHFTGGCTGFIFKGIPAAFDALLVTGDGTSAGGGIGIPGGYNTGTTATIPGTSGLPMAVGLLFMGSIISNVGSSLVGENGIAVYGFGNDGIMAIFGGTGWFPTTGPVITINNGLDGVGAYQGGKLIFAGPVLSFGNGWSGIQADVFGDISLLGNAYVDSNFAWGYGASDMSEVRHQGNVLWTSNNQLGPYSPPYGTLGNSNSLIA